MATSAVHDLACDDIRLRRHDLAYDNEPIAMKPFVETIWHRPSYSHPLCLGEEY